jgi:hypothetical protein
MDGKSIPFSENFLYPGLSIGNRAFKEKFVEDGFRRVEKCFYSLYSLGCKSGLLNPYTTGYIYKQYCQSVFKYGLELCFISNRTCSVVIVLLFEIKSIHAKLTAKLSRGRSIRTIYIIYTKYKLKLKQNLFTLNQSFY